MGGRPANAVGMGGTLLAALIVFGCSGSAPGATTAPTLQRTVAPNVPATADGSQPTATARATATSAAPATSSPVAATPAAATPAGELGIPSDPALFGTGLVPPGWQIVEDATGSCRIAAPPDWSTDVAPGTAQAGIAEALAAISAVTEDWETYKQTVDQLYLTGHVTLIDSDEIFLIANPPASELDFSYVLVLRRGEVNCHLVMTVQRRVIAQHAANAILIGQTLDATD